PDDRPTVYVTLGTFVSSLPEGRALFQMVLEALRDEHLNLILTVGRANDPAQFGPQPPNVHIEQYIPQSLLLPSCDLVVHHTGYNTVMAALNYGLPAVMLPISADQPYVAACAEALGLGRVVEPAERTVDTIRSVVRSVLADVNVRRQVDQVRAQTLAL